LYLYLGYQAGYSIPKVGQNFRQMVHWWMIRQRNCQAGSHVARLGNSIAKKMKGGVDNKGRMGKGIPNFISIR
jgi:hypothetical protein